MRGPTDSTQISITNTIFFMSGRCFQRFHDNWRATLFHDWQLCATFAQDC